MSSCPKSRGVPVKFEASTVWPIVHAERARLVCDLRDLPPHAWSIASLCADWTVHDVLAHLVDTAMTSRISFIRRMVLSRFDFDGDNASGIARRRRADPQATLAAMQAAINLTLTPPAAPATRLVEAFVHGEDIRRPLGIAAGYPPDAVFAALAHQAKTSTTWHGGRERVAGLRLVATDTGAEIGDGIEVRGRAVDLLVAASGRAVDGEALHGPGASRLLTARP
ncbi:maleylpyruvate isomerase family mycothiol-dependent enzyme [Mycobacterium pyrenivorans]|nr:maleylpyruvate isomerase family mycothiol-dependent enzyme [Mycolicibacterium pyrenivorans]